MMTFFSYTLYMNPYRPLQYPPRTNDGSEINSDNIGVNPNFKSNFVLISPLLGLKRLLV